MPNKKNQKDITTILQILKVAIPELDEDLSYLEKNNGWINLNEDFISLIQQWDLNWHKYYEDEKLLRTLSALMYFDADELKNINKEDGYESLLNEMLALNDEAENFNFDDLGSPEELAESFKNESEDEKNKVLQQFIIFFLGLLSTGFNFLALMLHGHTMCDLVSMAKDGDDKAFCKAVHVDRTVLNLPYFKQRMIKAQLGNDQGFLNSLSSRINKPLHKGKIKYKKLWLTFLILDDEGLLNSLSHEEIFDICELTGVYGKKHGIDDVGSISKRLRDYRKYQGKSKIF